METVLEIGGLWLARALAVYGIVVLVMPALTFANVFLLALLAWGAAVRARGRTPWPWLPARLRRIGRAALELTFGLINPLVYLLVLAPPNPVLRSEAWWHGPLMASAWVLLLAIWLARFAGGGVPVLRSRPFVRALLWSAAACLVAFMVKDAWLAYGSSNLSRTPDQRAFTAFGQMTVRLAPLYLIPLILLLAHVRRATPPAFFFSSGRGSRLALAAIVAVSSFGVVSALHRRSDTTVRHLVAEHRDTIRAAALQYEVDPRLVGAIIYVTHRDQLSPFRGALERMAMAGWADRFGGAETQLDVSVGIAQIKPRTAQTATVLAIARLPSDLGGIGYHGARGEFVNDYARGEFVNDDWVRVVGALEPRQPPIPVPSPRQEIVRALLEPATNIATCALILSLYQDQWEAVNAAWSIRHRPEILASLYQIGYFRSRPHGAPRPNAFGRRVREVYDQPWLGELLGPAPASATPEGADARLRVPAHPSSPEVLQLGVRPRT